MIPLTCKCFIVFKFASQRNVNLAKNYYSILEVTKNSDKKTIKKSYLKLVKIYHPDVNPKDKTKFTDIQEAF
jgi:curved DNA-binding protein CbpA